MNIYEAIGIFAVVLLTGLGLSVFLKFALDGARTNLPGMFNARRARD